MDFGTRSERLVGLVTLYVDSLYSTKSFTSFSSSDSLVNGIWATSFPLILFGFVYDVDYSYLRQYNETLGKISGNLNQIAKRINSTGNVYEEDMAEVKAIMDEVWKSQKAMLRKQPLIHNE